MKKEICYLIAVTVTRLSDMVYIQISILLLPCDSVVVWYSSQ